MKFTYKNIIEIHDKIAKNYSIDSNYLNINAIKSIVYRMNDNFNNSDIYPTVYDKAAVLFMRIIRCHPFIDGNKRTALASLSEYLANNNIVYLTFPSDVRFSVEVAKIHSNNISDSHILKNIKRWIMFHSANYNDDINIIIEKQLALIKTIINVAKNKNRPSMIDKTFDYWYATDIYPYYTTSYNGLEGIMQELEMEKEFFKHMDTLIELILKVARK
jgi:death-on-curing protein